MDNETLIAELKSHLAHAPKLGYRVKLDLKDEGVILVDGTQAPPEIAEDDGEADTTLTLSKDNLAKMMAGTLDPTMAYMTGKLKVSGSMGVALKLASLLGD